MGRMASIVRETRETRIEASLDIDNWAPALIATNLPLLTHFLSAFSIHGRFGLNLKAEGDVEVDPHHLVEDVGIVLGKAFRQAIGAGENLVRFGQRHLPMDEALVLCAVDISGRGQCYWGPGFPERAVGGIHSEVWPEFFHGFARQSGVTVHLRYVAGENAHHVYEACFKSFGVALSEAVSIREGRGVPSTKGVL